MLLWPAPEGNEYIAQCSGTGKVGQLFEQVYCELEWKGAVVAQRFFSSANLPVIDSWIKSQKIKWFVLNPCPSKTLEHKEGKIFAVE